MSYDIYLEDPDGRAHRLAGDCPDDADHECPGRMVDVGNYTYNVAGMFADALSVDPALSMSDGISRIMGFDGSDGPYGVHRFHGAPCVEAAGPLAEGVRRMEADPAHYRAMNPDNGWGSYEGALEYLRRFARLCADHPSRWVLVW